MNAQAIAIPGSYVRTLFFIEVQTVTLAVTHISHLTFKRLLTTGAYFVFVYRHRIMWIKISRFQVWKSSVFYLMAESQLSILTESYHYMNATFKKRLKKACLLLSLPFIVLFTFRMLYGYNATRYDVLEGSGDDFFSSITDLRKNYASEKMYKGNYQAHSGSESAQGTGGNQKYEKTASVRAKSSQFEKDVAVVNATTRRFSAVIQYEQNLGNKGNRESHLLIGVNPAAFDSFYQAVQHIGRITARKVTKVDKTNEYRQLNAKRTTLENTLASLNELKSKGGAIGDYITLHDKILEIQSQLQGLGVELGNFNTENEFCTVRFSLYEGAERATVSIWARLRTSLEWTIQYYCLLMVALASMAGLAFVVLVIAEKLKLVEKIRE